MADSRPSASLTIKCLGMEGFVFGFGHPIPASAIGIWTTGPTKLLVLVHITLKAAAQSAAREGFSRRRAGPEAVSKLAEQAERQSRLEAREPRAAAPPLHRSSVGGVW